MKSLLTFFWLFLLQMVVVVVGGGMKLVQTAIFQKSDWMLFCCLKCKFLSVFLCELLL